MCILSVFEFSVHVGDGFPKKKNLDGGWVGGVSYIQVFLGFFICKAPLAVFYLVSATSLYLYLRYFILTMCPTHFNQLITILPTTQALVPASLNISFSFSPLSLHGLFSITSCSHITVVAVQTGLDLSDMGLVKLMSAQNYGCLRSPL